MQSSRDSSLWRSLAVAFGDGLAFGVGVKLTQAAGRQIGAPRSRAPGASAPPLSGPTPLSDRIEQTEQNPKHVERVERTPVTSSGTVDQKVLEAIVHALEARLADYSGQLERRLADLEARFAIELRSLDQQDHSIAKHVSEDIGVLRRQMVGLHREFGEAVARIVAEQVGSQVEARAAVLEQSIAARVAIAVEAVVEPLERQLRAEVEQRDREIGELRQRLTDTDTKVLELILGIGQICRQTVEKIVPPTGPQERGSGHRQSPSPAVHPVVDLPTDGGEAAHFADLGNEPREGAVASRPSGEQEDGVGPESQCDHRVPGVAQARNPARLWRVPLVSSLVLATGGLALRHFL
jgi:hypothetical protein